MGRSRLVFTLLCILLYIFCINCQTNTTVAPTVPPSTASPSAAPVVPIAPITPIAPVAPVGPTTAPVVPITPTTASPTATPSTIAPSIAPTTLPPTTLAPVPPTPVDTCVYIATNGNDEADGSRKNPFKTLQKALSVGSRICAYYGFYNSEAPIVVDKNFTLECFANNTKSYCEGTVLPNWSTVTTFTLMAHKNYVIDITNIGSGFSFHGDDTILKASFENVHWNDFRGIVWIGLGSLVFTDSWFKNSTITMHPHTEGDNLIVFMDKCIFETTTVTSWASISTVRDSSSVASSFSFKSSALFFMGNVINAFSGSVPVLDAAISSSLTVTKNLFQNCEIRVTAPVKFTTVGVTASSELHNLTFTENTFKNNTMYNVYNQQSQKDIPSVSIPLKAKKYDLKDNSQEPKAVCGKGSFSTGYILVCDVCPRGEISKDPASDKCTPCNTNKREYTRTTGASSCLPCASRNVYSSVNGVYSCVICAEGEYKDTNVGVDGACKKCGSIHKISSDGLTCSVGGATFTGMIVGIIFGLIVILAITGFFIRQQCYIKAHKREYEAL